MRSDFWLQYFRSGHYFGVTVAATRPGVECYRHRMALPTVRTASSPGKPFKVWFVRPPQTPQLSMDNMKPSWVRWFVMLLNSEQRTPITTASTGTGEAPDRDHWRWYMRVVTGEPWKSTWHDRGTYPPCLPVG